MSQNPASESFDDVFLEAGSLSSSRWDEGLIRSAQEFHVRSNLSHSEMVLPVQCA